MIFCCTMKIFVTPIGLKQADDGAATETVEVGPLIRPEVAASHCLYLQQLLADGATKSMISNNKNVEDLYKTFPSDEPSFR